MKKIDFVSYWGVCFIFGVLGKRILNDTLWLNLLLVVEHFFQDNCSCFISETEDEHFEGHMNLYAYMIDTSMCMYANYKISSKRKTRYARVIRQLCDYLGN